MQAASAQAQSIDGPQPRDLSRESLRALLQRTEHDAVDLTTAPARWRSHEWTRFGEGIALVGVAYAADTKILDALQRNHRHITDQYLHRVTSLGGGLGEQLTVAAIVTGYLTHDGRLMNTGIDAFESSLWAAGIVTPAIKRIAGRARPIQHEGQHSYHPFNGSYQSFPSGHSTNAWAIATAVATRYEDQRAVPIVAYALATSVSLARVNERKHFPSDVVAGALIAHAVAKSIVHDHLSIAPTGRGIAMLISF